MNVEELYKPFRNYLRKVSLTESLWVIHAYGQHLQYARGMPREIEVLSSVSAKGVLGRFVHPWSLDVLAREVLINSPDESARLTSRSLRSWNYFAATLNKLKDFEDALGETYPKGSIMLELHRIAHRQRG